MRHNTIQYLLSLKSAPHRNTTPAPCLRWSEALHGVARDGLATSFPQIIGVASSLNTSLWSKLGAMTGIEARGKNNDRTATGQYQGLTLWAPNVNIFRDPRWGRGQETPGEDPTVNGAYAAAYIGGLQGDEASNGALLSSACVKHFAAYSEETDRDSFPAVVTNADMQDTYLPAFEAAVVDGAASCVMVRGVADLPQRRGEGELLTRCFRLPQASVRACA